MKKDNLQTFLNELAELSRKHDIYIGGCGCCGSPVLYDSKDQSVAESLGYSDKEYTVQE